jgi:uncharacterized protein (DUF58 family)
VDFDSHRDYHPGDDPRHINWPLFARHRRLCIKEYLTETHLPLYLFLDASGSMSVSSAEAQKLHYAARAIAALARLAYENRDAAGLFVLKNEVQAALQPRTGIAHFQHLLATLAGTEAAGPGDLTEALEQTQEYCRRRGMVVLFSDLFDKEDGILRGLRTLREHGHDVVVFQVLDPLECELPKSGDVQFKDAETGETLRTSVAEIRESYEKAVDDWRRKFRDECEGSGIDWVTTSTADPLARVVSEFLYRRQR